MRACRARPCTRYTRRALSWAMSVAGIRAERRTAHRKSVIPPSQRYNAPVRVTYYNYRYAELPLPTPRLAPP